MPAPGQGPRQRNWRGGRKGEEWGKIHLKSQTKANPAKCRSQHNRLCESNYHNDVKEPNQQSGANLSCITGLSFPSVPQLNAFLMKIFLDLQIISHSLQGGYQSSLSGLFFFLYIYMYLSVCIYIYPICSEGQRQCQRREREGKTFPIAEREGCGGRTGFHQESFLSASPLRLCGFPPLWCSQIIKYNKKIVGVQIGVLRAGWASAVIAAPAMAVEGL